MNIKVIIGTNNSDPTAQALAEQIEKTLQELHLAHRAICTMSAPYSGNRRQKEQKIRELATALAANVGTANQLSVVQKHQSIQLRQTFRTFSKNTTKKFNNKKNDGTGGVQ